MIEYAIQGFRASPLSSKFVKKHQLTLQDMCGMFEEYYRTETDYKRCTSKQKQLHETQNNNYNDRQGKKAKPQENMQPGTVNNI